MSLLALLLAEGEAAPPQGNPLGFLFPMLIIFFAFYLIVIRPANRREQERQAKLLSTMEKGDKVMTIAGIYGTIISVAEKEDEVVVKVDDNTRLRMTKRSIVQNMTREEEAAKAAQAAKEEAAKK
jgi:preprotein translocase subunit YajC